MNSLKESAIGVTDTTSGYSEASRSALHTNYQLLSWLLHTTRHFQCVISLTVTGEGVCCYVRWACSMHFVLCTAPFVVDVCCDVAVSISWYVKIWIMSVWLLGKEVRVQNRAA